MAGSSPSLGLKFWLQCLRKCFSKSTIRRRNVVANTFTETILVVLGLQEERLVNKK